MRPALHSPHMQFARLSSAASRLRRALRAIR
jgi:hypothetical protein